MALQSSPPSSSSSSSFSNVFKYDVFLNFRGADTRFGFTGNLYNALRESGIRTFIDDIELQIGDEITSTLFKAIEESRIFIPVFSINYASSSFSLNELVHIMECSKAEGRLVLPVFYGVDPSHVRHQTGSYGEALAELEVRFQNNLERLQKWKMALYQAAKLFGPYLSSSLRIVDEYEFIRKIVNEVSNKINSVFLSFKGTDTRYGFTGNLHHALVGREILTFFDDRELRDDYKITPALLKAIEDSRIFIPVFSIDYASSSLCLDELVHIMKFSKAKNRLVVPVFFGVVPSDVRHQTGSYGEAIAYHEQMFQKNREKYADNMERLQNWKMALEQAANLSGYHFKIGNEYEHKLIGNIVKTLSSFSSPSGRFIYDVFLSFRGIDTRYHFTGNLCNALDGSGIHTFLDDVKLQRGDEITPSLLNAIEHSRIFIPIFSINYASSSFCLDELVHIMKCSKEMGRLVLPVFYEVDRSHVRDQTDSYGAALGKHEETFQNNKESSSHNMKRLQDWKMALTQAANLSDHHFNPRNDYEHTFIGNIVKEVSNKISHAPLHVADYPVGLKSRVQHVKLLLDEGFDDGVHIIGIYGKGGVGKTTLAKAIYNFIADQFECSCFLHNVRENSAKHELKHLQEMLLSQTVGLDIKLGDVREGIRIIKQSLHQKKVLLILDDVEKLEQLQVLTGRPDWFGLGSNVIITTRDKPLLESHGIEIKYEVGELNAEEALKLLRWKAFKSDEVGPRYEDILKLAVTYVSGLPLALEVVGSDLFVNHLEVVDSDLFVKPLEVLTSTLDRYGKIPNKETQKILRVSFGALKNVEQSVFLDIACRFKGDRLAEVEDILRARYGDKVKYHIGVLVEKSLIKIDKWHWHVTLHDLIEDMAKEIDDAGLGQRHRLYAKRE